jgi:hypothetical protein
MQSRHEWCGLTRKQGKWIVVQMKMHEVKLIGEAPYLLQHRHVQSHWIANRVVETQRAWPNGLKLGRCSRIATRKQHDIVPKRDEFFCQPGNDALGATIQVGRNRFGQRRDLRDAHTHSL